MDLPTLVAACAALVYIAVVVYILKEISVSLRRIAVAVEDRVGEEDEALSESTDVALDPLSVTNLLACARGAVEHYRTCGCDSIRFSDKMLALEAAVEKFDADAKEEKA